MKTVENLILGAGISGISASFHIGHEKCLILEKNDYAFGILKSHEVDKYTWDQGPHVSFTKHDYVKELFAKNVNNEYEEHAVKPSNYYQGSWIDHPVQSNLFQLPKDIKDKCVASFLLEREKNEKAPTLENYRDWLSHSLGSEIANRFVAVYTRKYWTTELQELTTDWIGPRVHVPNTQDFLDGANGTLGKNPHYISKIRYPTNGGYESFVKPLAAGADVRYGYEIVNIDLRERIVTCANGESFLYRKLVSTIPLPVFIHCTDSLDSHVYTAAKRLRCSNLLLVNVEIPHKVSKKEHWLYVYDEDMLSCRITIMDNLSQNNAPIDRSAVQVEVYHSSDKPLGMSDEKVAEKVVGELITMGIVHTPIAPADVRRHTRRLEFANVIFDHQRRDALDTIFSCLSDFGLHRRGDDLDALTDWNNLDEIDRGALCFLGRFGEWKYYWSDDCVMAGKALAGT